MQPLSTRKRKAKAELEAVAERISKNVLRMGYRALLSRGFQIGSGAMESLHRTGCQLRVKGPAWLKETAQAIFNVRMLRLIGHWEAFWSQETLLDQLAIALPAITRDISSLKSTAHRIRQAC
jgi:hypothetical protein